MLIYQIHEANRLIELSWISISFVQEKKILQLGTTYMIESLFLRDERNYICFHDALWTEEVIVFFFRLDFQSEVVNLASMFRK